MSDWWDPEFGDPELFGEGDVPGTVTPSVTPTATVTLAVTPTATVEVTVGPDA